MGRIGMTPRSLFVTSLLGVLFVARPPQIVERIERFYEGTRDVKGRFTQRVELAMGQVEEARGTFYLQRPGRMRWEYEEPERRLLVTDGSSLWVYTPADRQVIVQDLKAALTAIPFDFLVGTGRLTEQFVVRSATARGDGYRLELTPRYPDAHLAELQMEVEGTSLHMRSLSFQDPYENRTIMRFSHLALNSGLPSELFSFVPPSGVKVLRAEDLYSR